MRPITPPWRRASLWALLTAFLLTLLGSLTQAASAVSTPDTGTKPAEGRSYVIGTDTTYAPFEMRGPDGEMIGIDMDLLRAIAQDQGFSVEIRSLGFDAAVQALQADQVDAVMAGMTITDERRQTFDFSDPYFDTGIQMAVPQDSDIASYEDLEGLNVAVKTGTAGADFADSIKDQYGFTTTAFGQTADMLNDVTAGSSAAFFEDAPVVQYGIQQGNGMKTVTEQEPTGSYGMAVNKGANPELLQAFNQGLQNLKANGEYDRIVSTYLGDAGAGERSGFFGLLGDAMPALLRGLALTLAATALSILFALVLGVVFGFLKVSDNKALAAVAGIYVAVFRGTPVLVQVFFFYFGIPAVTGATLSAFTAGVLTLSLNAGAYMTEIVRGGIQSVDPGQMEASRSLGLSYMTSMRKVVIPQAVKIMTPSFINQFVITLKDTSLLAVIGFAELTYQGQQIIATSFRSFEIWLIIGVIYFIVITVLTTVSNHLDRRINK
jgi:glutamine transport system permease protein